MDCVLGRPTTDLRRRATHPHPPNELFAAVRASWPESREPRAASRVAAEDRNYGVTGCGAGAAGAAGAATGTSGAGATGAGATGAGTAGAVAPGAAVV